MKMTSTLESASKWKNKIPSPYPLMKKKNSVRWEEHVHQLIPSPHPLMKPPDEIQWGENNMYTKWFPPLSSDEKGKS